MWRCVFLLMMDGLRAPVMWFLRQIAMTSTIVRGAVDGLPAVLFARMWKTSLTVSLVSGVPTTAPYLSFARLSIDYFLLDGEVAPINKKSAAPLATPVYMNMCVYTW